MNIPRQDTPFRMTPGMWTLAALALFGLGLIVYRFIFGLGSVTNLSDGYPWGIWISVDVLIGIALAAGGFVVAGLVHIFGGHRYHALVRPAILTALLGYLLFAFALIVDLGRPWHMWQILFSWNQDSPMFEVSWCVIFYTTVLILEFAPVIFDRFRLDRLRSLWLNLTPFFIIFALTLFTYAMSHSSVGWALTMLVIVSTWEVLMRRGVMPRDKQMPLLLIMAGIMFSTMHQSSLGTIYLIMDKVHTLWYSPTLPLLFFLSAVMTGIAMIIFEATLSARVRRAPVEFHLLRPLSQGLPYLIGFYLLLRLGDLVVRGAVLETMTLSANSVFWWTDIGLLVAAFVILTTPDMLRTPRGLMLGASLTLISLVVNRLGVSMIGYSVPEYNRYVPAWPEVMITVGIFATGLIALRLAMHYLPIYEEDHSSAPAPAPATAGEAGR